VFCSSRLCVGGFGTAVVGPPRLWKTVMGLFSSPFPDVSYTKADPLRKKITHVNRIIVFGLIVKYFF